MIKILILCITLAVVSTQAISGAVLIFTDDRADGVMCVYEWVRVGEKGGMHLKIHNCYVSALSSTRATEERGNEGVSGGDGESNR